jgi:hypothetical protein
LSFSFAQHRSLLRSIGAPSAELLLKPFRMLDDDLATIDHCQHDDQPDLKEEIQLIRHGASPW